MQFTWRTNDLSKFVRRYYAINAMYEKWKTWLEKGNNGVCYTGNGAREKALKQGRAIHVSKNRKK